MTMASNSRALLLVGSVFALALAAFGGCLDVTPTKPYGCRSGDSGCAGSSSSSPSSGGSSASTTIAAVSSGASSGSGAGGAGGS
jgi:hypothetical protein